MRDYARIINFCIIIIIIIIIIINFSNHGLVTKTIHRETRGRGINGPPS